MNQTDVNQISIVKRKILLAHSQLQNVQIEAYGKAMEQPKEQVRRLILNPAIGSNEKLSLIYYVYRLGLTYIFSKDIDGQLDKLFNELNLQSYEDADLYTISIHFQVFRIFGYRFSCGKSLIKNG
ncbi:putative lyase [Helianthus anomalus]